MTIPSDLTRLELTPPDTTFRSVMSAVRTDVALTVRTPIEGEAPPPVDEWSFRKGLTFQAVRFAEVDGVVETQLGPIFYEHAVGLEVYGDIQVPVLARMVPDGDPDVLLCDVVSRMWFNGYQPYRYVISRVSIDCITLKCDILSHDATTEFGYTPTNRSSELAVAADSLIIIGSTDNGIQVSSFSWDEGILLDSLEVVGLSREENYNNPSVPMAADFHEGRRELMISTRTAWGFSEDRMDQTVLLNLSDQGALQFVYATSWPQTYISQGLSATPTGWYLMRMSRWWDAGGSSVGIWDLDNPSVPMITYGQPSVPPGYSYSYEHYSVEDSRLSDSEQENGMVSTPSGALAWFMSYKNHGNDGEEVESFPVYVLEIPYGNPTASNKFTVLDRYDPQVNAYFVPTGALSASANDTRFFLLHTWNSMLDNSVETAFDVYAWNAHLWNECPEPIVVPGEEEEPVQRIYPRDDGRGLSAAPRIHPRPTSEERIYGDIP